MVGFEPTITESKSIALPLGDTPKAYYQIIISYVIIIVNRR